MVIKNKVFVSKLYEKSGKNLFFSYLCVRNDFVMSREQLIAKHRNLFWYTPEDQKQDISDALLVERILNDGTLDDCRELVAILGGKRVAEVFFSAKGRQIMNYYPEIYHFFSLVLKKYA